MTLPVFRRFTLQDIPAAPNWMSNILTPLNLFCETTVSSLNKNLTIGDNVQGQKFSTSFTTPSDYSGGGFPTVRFAYTGGGQPNCLLLGSISRANGTQLLSPVSINDWFLNINQNPFQVTVNYIAGLAANTKYNVTFLVI
jgi:hypothetical protein